MKQAAVRIGRENMHQSSKLQRVMQKSLTINSHHVSFYLSPSLGTIPPTLQLFGTQHSIVDFRAPASLSCPHPPHSSKLTPHPKSSKVLLESRLIWWTNVYWPICRPPWIPPFLSHPLCWLSCRCFKNEPSGGKNPLVKTMTNA